MSESSESEFQSATSDLSADDDSIHMSSIGTEEDSAAAEDVRHTGSLSLDQFEDSMQLFSSPLPPASPDRQFPSMSLSAPLSPLTEDSRNRSSTSVFLDAEEDMNGHDEERHQHYQRHEEAAREHAPGAATATRASVEEDAAAGVGHVHEGQTAVDGSTHHHHHHHHQDSSSQEQEYPDSHHSRHHSQQEEVFEPVQHEPLSSSPPSSSTLRPLTSTASTVTSDTELGGAPETPHRRTPTHVPATHPNPVSAGAPHPAPVEKGSPDVLPSAQGAHAFTPPATPRTRAGAPSGESPRRAVARAPQRPAPVLPPHVAAEAAEHAALQQQQQQQQPLSPRAHSQQQQEQQQQQQQESHEQQQQQHPPAPSQTQRQPGLPGRVASPPMESETEVEGDEPGAADVTIDEESQGEYDGAADAALRTPKHKGDGRPSTPPDDIILQQTTLKCLDTGEVVPLAEMGKILPTALNPLALQVMQRTNEFPGTEGTEGEGEDEHEGDAKKDEAKPKAHGSGMRKFLSRAKEKAQKTMRALLEDNGEKKEVALPMLPSDSPDPQIKIHAHSRVREPFIQRLRLVQDVGGPHMGAVWTMKFSACGKLLATAGYDKIVRVWVVKDALATFEQMRIDQGGNAPETIDANLAPETPSSIFAAKPFSVYEGHTADVLDLSWSQTKNYFLLSSSMDKTVRLWHVSRQQCLACFPHEDFVTAIAFHPRNDKYFLSGSLDSKLRLWNIPEKKVVLWNQVGGGQSTLITAANFCKDGQLAVAGTYDGRCIFFNTSDRLRYHTQLHVRSKRGRNKGQKISGIEPSPNGEKILVTSNDSRLRLYDLKDCSLTCKFKGLTNTSSQIRASFSPEGSHVICGSEDQGVFFWETNPEPPPHAKKFRRDRNEDYQCFRAHNASVTASVIAPRQVGTPLEKSEVIVSADFDGFIKVFVCDTLKKQ